MLNQDDEKLSGVCEVDGVYVGDYIKPANNIADRIDRRKAYKPNKKLLSQSDKELMRVLR